jgi:hypothetical protein
MEKVIIETGKEFSNYAKLCAYLGEVPQTGYAKILHMDYLLEFFSYEKVKGKHKITIKEVFKPNYIKLAERTYGKRDCKWNKNVSLQILSELYLTLASRKTHALPYKLEKMVIYAKDLYNLVGLCNGKFHKLRNPGDESFRKILEDYAKATNKSVEDKTLGKEVYSWFMDTNNKFYQIMEDVLQSLTKQNIVIYTRTFVISHISESSGLRLATGDEDKEIRLTKGKIIREMGFKSEQSILKVGIGSVFYTKLAKALKEKFSIELCYSVYEIAWTAESLEILENYKRSIEETLKAKIDINKKSYEDIMNADNGKHKYLVDLLIPVSM